MNDKTTIIPTTEYTPAELVIVLGLSLKKISKEMAEWDYEVDDKGQYFGSDILRAGLGTIRPGYTLQPSKEPEIVECGIFPDFPDSLYSISEIGSFYGISGSVLKRRFLKHVPLASKTEQEKAGFTEGYRFFGQVVLDAVKKNPDLIQPPKKNNRVTNPEPVTPETPHLAVNIFLLKIAVEGMDKMEAVTLLRSFAEGLELGTL